MKTRLRTASSLALGVLLASAVGAGCVHTPVDVQPSLAPVDASRPIVRYKAIQGSACAPMILHFIPAGDSSLLSALWEMKRLENVDGYLEVTVEQKVVQWILGHTRCTVVTAYPFTYGEEARDLRLRGTGEAPRGRAEATRAPAAGGRPQEPPPEKSEEPAAAPADECPTLCEGFGELAGATRTIRNIVRDKCITRCASGDEAYRQCVREARRVEDVKRCNGLPGR